MKPGGLLIAIGKKPKGEEEEAAPGAGAEESSDFDESAAAAFEAMKSGDLESFKMNLRAAIMACEDY